MIPSDPSFWDIFLDILYLVHCFLDIFLDILHPAHCFWDIFLDILYLVHCFLDILRQDIFHLALRIWPLGQLSVLVLF